MSDDVSVHTAVIMARGLGTRMRAPLAAAAVGAPGAAPAPNDMLRSAETHDDAVRDDAVYDDAVHSAAARGAADAGIKTLIPLGGRPLLDHVLSALADVGVTSAIVVIGPEQDMLRDYLEHLETHRIAVTAAIQAEPRGTADALAAALPSLRAHHAGERFLLLNSDNYYPPEALSRLVAAPGAATLGFDAAALIAHSNIPAERVRSFALLAVHADGSLAGITEKPSAETAAALGPDAPVSMNAWMLTPEVAELAPRTPASPRGEFELTDTVRLAIEAGIAVHVVPCACGVLDLTGRGDIADVTARLGQDEVRL